MNIILIITVAIIIIIWNFHISDIPRKYRNRSCTGKNWKTQFPHTPKEEIREFLFVFTDAFAFSDQQKLKFKTNDKILDIYKALYPIESMPDSLEVETLADSIEEKYSINFADIWHENITLGELFAKVSHV